MQQRNVHCQCTKCTNNLHKTKIGTAIIHFFGYQHYKATMFLVVILRFFQNKLHNPYKILRHRDAITALVLLIV